MTQRSVIAQLSSPFQIEVNNAWQLYKEKVKGTKNGKGIKHKAAFFEEFSAIMIGNFMLNTITDLLIHRRVVFDPIYVLLEAIGEGMDDDDDDKEEKDWTKRRAYLRGKELGETFSVSPCLNWPGISSCIGT